MNLELEVKHNPGKEILVIKVEVTEDQQDEIVVHENDEPTDLAKKFCSKYGLDQRMWVTLAETIEQHIDQLLEEELNSKPTTERNPGHELYNKGLEMINKRDQLIHEIRKQREQEFEKNLTFKPEISKHNINYALLEKAKKVHEGMLQEYKSGKDVSYSFKPTINPKYVIYSSQEILKERTQDGMSSFSRLYQEAQMRLTKIQKKTEIM